MNYQDPRTRNPGRHYGRAQRENPSFSRSSTSSSWRDRPECGGGFYEIGGISGHIPEYQTYAKKSESSLITALFSESSPIKLSSGAIQLVLGISEEGTQHLLIQDKHYRELRTSYSQHLPPLKRHPPYYPQEFATLSPIAFRAPVGDGECELSKKLKSITKSRKKKNLCISSAEARERIDYERSRTLLRILREDTLFFDVPIPQIGCFVILYTNNTTVELMAKDIVFGTVHTDRLRDRDALTEQINPDNIEHIRVAGSDMFHANIELEDLPVGTYSLSKNECLPRIALYLRRLRGQTRGQVVVLVDDWNKVLEVLLPPHEVPPRPPGDPHPFALMEQSTLGGLRWQRGIAPLLQYGIPTAESGGKYEGLNRPMKDKDQDLQQDYGGSRSRYGSTHTSNRATPRRSPSPVCAPDFYVVETRRMYKLVRGSGNLPDSARDGCTAFGLDIPGSGPVLELKLIWSLWVKMASGLPVDEERTRNWQRNVTLGIPDEEEEAQQQEGVPAESESLEAMFNGSTVAQTRQPEVRRAIGGAISGAYLDSWSDEDDF